MLIRLCGLLGLSVLYSSAFATPVVFDELRLTDVQQYIGGNSLHIKSNGDFAIKIVKPARSGLSPIEFSGTLTKRQLRRINRAVKRSRFHSIHLITRSGSDAGAGPKIELVRSGETMSKQKWLGDQHRQFDELYGTLLALIKKLNDRNTKLNR